MADKHVLPPERKYIKRARAASKNQIKHCMQASLLSGRKHPQGARAIIAGAKRNNAKAWGVAQADKPPGNTVQGAVAPGHYHGFVVWRQCECLRGNIRFCKKNVIVPCRDAALQSIRNPACQRDACAGAGYGVD